MTLRFRGADIGWISSLLHDAGVLWENVRHDQPTQLLTIEINRPRYEAPRHQRFLGVIPIVRYQSVPARLTTPGSSESRSPGVPSRGRTRRMLTTSSSWPRATVSS